MLQNHPIFTESIRLIRESLGETGLEPLQQHVLERLIHSSGDLKIGERLCFSPNACELGIKALRGRAPILTDTEMAAAAVRPMAKRTLGVSVRCVLEWAPAQAPTGSTRSAVGLRAAWKTCSVVKPAPLILIGSAPTALNELLNLVEEGLPAPSLVIGMPVGFVGVAESKDQLAKSALAQIRLDGTRGGAGLVAASVNALLMASFC
jgi:precorrin-8X/cobalt-precorrin-8 methylmutase